MGKILIRNFGNNFVIFDNFEKTFGRTKRTFY